LKKVNSFGNMPSCWKSSIVFSYWSALLSIPCKLAFAWKLFAYTAPGAIAARSASIQGIPFAFQPECLQYLVMFDTWVSCICFSKIKNASNWSAQVYSITTENWEWAVNSNINSASIENHNSNHVHLPSLTYFPTTVKKTLANSLYSCFLAFHKPGDWSKNIQSHKQHPSFVYGSLQISLSQILL
jgi:hypothetical protein